MEPGLLLGVWEVYGDGGPTFGSKAKEIPECQRCGSLRFRYAWLGL